MDSGFIFDDGVIGSHLGSSALILGYQWVVTAWNYLRQPGGSLYDFALSKHWLDLM